MGWSEISAAARPVARPVACPVAHARSVLGDRWTMPPLCDRFRSMRRFDEFQYNPGVTRHVLTTVCASSRQPERCAVRRIERARRAMNVA
jgi:hypothetical protein